MLSRDRGEHGGEILQDTKISAGRRGAQGPLDSEGATHLNRHPT